MRMYYLKRWFVRKFFKIIRYTPLSMPMVKYWKHTDKVAAKIMTSKDGSLIMQMEGEKELFPGFPRAHVLFGKLSKLKHEVKNQVFNQPYTLLEKNKEKEALIQIKEKLTGGLNEYLEPCKYDFLPTNKMCIPVRELWRTFTKLEEKEPKIKFIKEYLCFLTQEDDSYRWRLQWVFSLFRWSDPKDVALALQELENAEVIGDMKGFVRLWKRIILFALKDSKINDLFKQFCKELDWKKMKLTKADKYHFRGKYFKVDFDKFEY